MGVGVREVFGFGVGIVFFNAKIPLRKSLPVVFMYPFPTNMIESVSLVFQKADPWRAPGTILGWDSFNAPYLAGAFTTELPLIHAR